MQAKPGPFGSRWAGLPMLPAGLAAFHVLGLYVQSGVSPFTMIRALVAALSIALAITVIAQAALRDRGKATLLATAAVFVVLGWQALPALVVAGILVLVVTAVLPRLLRIRFPWGLVAPVGNSLAFILMLTLAIRGAQNGTLGQLPLDIGWALAGAVRPAPGPASTAPDIYLLMLEDYPRADYLQRVLGFDNGPFLAAMTDRGFIVSAKSRSNYSNSELTLVTMFQARHIEAISDLDQLRAQRGGDDQPLLRRLMNSGVVLDVLRDNGYSVIATSAGYGQLELRAADRFHDSPQLNDFERTILQTTAFRPALDAIAPSLVGQQTRDRIHAVFAFVTDVSREAADGPRFVFAHVPAPHPPIVFGPRGEPVDVALGDPYYVQLGDLARFRTLYGGELEYLNGLVLKAVDDLDAARRPSVTIVMSDEGIGFLVVAETTRDPVDSVVSLFAARTPGHEDLFGSAITPINVFPLLLERYLGADLPRQSDRNYISGSEAPFDGFEIPNSDASEAGP